MIMIMIMIMMMIIIIIIIIINVRVITRARRAWRIRNYSTRWKCDFSAVLKEPADGACVTKIFFVPVVC